MRIGKNAFNNVLKDVLKEKPKILKEYNVDSAYQFIIPSELLKSNISPFAKSVFGILYFSCLKNKSDFTSKYTIASLADIFGTTVQNMYHIVSILQKKKLIEYDGKMGDKKIKGFFKIKGFLSNLKKTEYIINNTNGIINYNKNNNNKIHTKYEVRKNSTNQNTMSQRIRNKITTNKTTKPKTTFNPLLDQIMSMGNLPRHKPNTNVYLNSSKLLELLKKGQLFTKTLLDQKWLKQFNITKILINQIWPDYLLIPIFENISKMYTLGFEPENKSTLPKTVQDILYNPRSHKSLFLKAAASGRVRNLSTAEIKRNNLKISLEEQNTLDILIPTIEKCFKPKREINKEEYKFLVKAAQKIKGFFDSYGTNIICACLLDFVKDYALWIEDEQEGRLNDARWFGPGTSDWNRYVRHRGI